MPSINLRPAEPERDFAELAALFSTQEDEPTTQSGLKEYYAREKEWIFQRVAEDEQGELLGCYWAQHSRSVAGLVVLDLIVKPEHRRQGVGSRLYEDFARAVAATSAKKVRTGVRDTCPECRAFVEKLGFRERLHQIGMSLDLKSFDDRPYDAIIERLKGEGFHFTSMEELGNTAEAQRKLYQLNDSAVATTPGSEGEHAWASFEDFQKSVCQRPWYRPGGQMVVIDTATGAWAAMSAITRLEGNDYAYNLFTGVDVAYRGRKLAQAVKVTALRYARDVLQAGEVRTHHNTFNQPILAIDRKLGYVQLPGTYSMEKDLA